jgi:hypothetical protein
VRWCRAKNGGGGERLGRGLIPRPVWVPSVERRVAAVTPRAMPIARRAAISPTGTPVAAWIGTAPIQMARPTRSPVTVGAAPVGDLNDHRRRFGERLNRHGPKFRECRHRNRGAEEKRKRFQQSGLLPLRRPKSTLPQLVNASSRLFDAKSSRLPRRRLFCTPQALDDELGRRRLLSSP